MEKIRIPKKTKGEFREIMMPNDEERIVFQNLLPKLNEKSQKFCGANVHGFMIGKSPVTNAKEHIGYNYTLCFDIKDFFDNVKEFHVNKKLTEEEIKICMPDGRAYQGLPSSPCVANIGGSDMDKAILRRLEKIGGNIKYTRYADDLSFSFNEFQYYSILKSNIPQIVGVCGFKINEKKTRLQDSRFGNRVITGVSVGKSDISATRSVRRRLRAAEHQKNNNQARGLKEWIKLKIPNPDKVRYNQKDVDELTKIWKLPKINLINCPRKKEVDLGNDVIVTGDLPYVLGPSNFGTNWKSCLQHPNGGSHMGTPLYVMMLGIRIALLLSDETIKIGSFTRRKAKARVLVYDTAQGSFYGRSYGESDAAKAALKEKLEENKINHVSFHKDIPILGKVLAENVKKTYCELVKKVEKIIDGQKYICLTT